MPFPTPWCSSYWKGSLQVTLDYGRQLYLLIKVVFFLCLISLNHFIVSNEFFHRIYLELSKIFVTIFCITFFLYQSQFGFCQVNQSDLFITFKVLFMILKVNISIFFYFVYLSQVELYQTLKKMVLDATLLSTQHYKVRSRVKWSNPGNGVAPSPTPWYSSYWKGSLRVTLN